MFLHGVTFVDSFLFEAFTLKTVSFGIKYLRWLRAFGLERGECGPKLIFFHFFNYN